MLVKLLRQVLVNDRDIVPSPRGAVVDLLDDHGKYFVENGLAEEYPGGAKMAGQHQNKMMPPYVNKADVGKVLDDGKGQPSSSSPVAQALAMGTLHTSKRGGGSRR